MKKFSLFINSVVFMIIMTGCGSNQIALTVYSNPSGAIITTSNSNNGYAPTTLYYTIDETSRKQGYIQTNWIAARWVSGASTYVNGLRLYLSRGNNQTYTFQRPNVKGYEKDAQFAIKLQTLRVQQAQLAAMRAQAAAAKRAADDAYWANWRRNQELSSINSYLRYGY